MTVSTVVTKALVDTNIFRGAADPAAGDKHHHAFGLIEQLTRRGDLVVSVQVLNEFYHASTRPNKPPSLTHEEASQTIQDLRKLGSSVDVDRLHDTPRRLMPSPATVCPYGTP